MVALASLLAFDESLGLVLSRVALVDELVVEVEEARVIFEVVGLPVEEGVELRKVRCILSLTIRLRSMVSMTVHISEVFLSVCHVLAIVDLIELPLAIPDLPGISRANSGVLAEVGTDEGSIAATVVLADQHLGHSSDSDKVKNAPAACHSAIVRVLGHPENAHKGTAEPAKVRDATSTRPEALQLSPILEAHVIGEQVTHIAVAILMDVVVFEAIVLDLHFREPRTARDLAHAAKVAHGAELIQHFLCRLI